MIHLDDQSKLRALLGELILTRPVHASRISCRVRTFYEDYFVSMNAGLQCGTQGIHCTMWNKDGCGQKR